MKSLMIDKNGWSKELATEGQPYWVLIERRPLYVLPDFAVPPKFEDTIIRRYFRLKEELPDGRLLYVEE